MKKIITSTMIIIIVICLCFTSTGCLDFLFSSLGLGNDNSESENKIVLQIHINDSTISVDAYEDKSVHIDKIATKYGYYITGYFDAPEGGTKYFDSDGNSLSVWSKSNPTEFYAQWANVDNYNIISKPVVWDNTYSFNSEANLGYYTNIATHVSAIDGNLSRTLRLTLSFKASCPAAGWGDDPNKQVVRYLKIVDTDDKSAESFYSTKFIINGLEYNDYSFDIDISARAFSKTTQDFKTARIFYFKFYAPNSIMREKIYLKDVQLTSMYFLPENE